MQVKEYKTSKTAAKTLKDNNLIQGKKDSYINCLLDLSLLDSLNLSEIERDSLTKEAIKCISTASKTLFYGSKIDNFTCFDGIAEFNKHRVFNLKTGKYLYDIMELKEINHRLGNRKSVYEQYYNVVNQTLNSKTVAPINDIEVA